MLIRQAARKETALRDISFITDVCRSVDGSCVIKMGHTHVLCSAMIEKNLEGIVTECGILPTATFPRSVRNTEKKSFEILSIESNVRQSLYSIIDMDLLGGKYGIRIDCDVLQSEGGVLAAAISGAYVAMVLALRKFSGLFSHSPIIGQVAGLSSGIVKGEYIVDLDCQESLEADSVMTFAINEKEEIISMDLKSKFQSVTLQQIVRATEMVMQSVYPIFEAQRQILGQTNYVKNAA